ncbi:MAG: porin, partial [Betaproteobacteria bacterium HGW-Betaproteobacteria-8]
MNKKLGMAVAGAVMAFGASAANAGITIPAGDWTIDIGGNVNAYYTNTRFDGDLDTDGSGNFGNDNANT